VSNQVKGVVAGMSETLRVLHVVGRMDRGGAETLIMNMYRHIDRNRVQFDFVVHGDGEGAFDSEIRDMGGRIFHAPRYRGINHLSYRQWWRSLFSEHPEFSIVHGHMQSTGSIYLREAKRAGRRTIAHSHNTSAGQGVKALAKEYLQRNIGDYADWRLACSSDAGTWLFGRDACDLDDFFILKNAIDTKEHNLDPTTRMRTRAALGVEDRIVIGHVGRFHPQKNHEFLLDVFAEYHRRDPRAVLLLVGDGPLRSSIEATVGRLGLGGDVIMTGVRPDIPDLLQAMDMFLFPSLYEGLGIALVEAQASGLPCIASDCIPSEARLTDLLVFVPLQSPASHWADLMAEHLVGRPRVDRCAEVAAAGYDIAEQSDWLMGLYRRAMLPRLAFVTDNGIFEMDGSFWHTGANVQHYATVTRAFQEIDFVGNAMESQTDANPVDHRYSVQLVERVVKGAPSPSRVIALRRVLYHVVGKDDVVMCFGTNGFFAARLAHKLGKPVLAYVGGCVYDTLIHMDSMVKRLAAPVLFLMMRQVTSHAAYVHYVDEYLTKRYPTRGRVLVCPSPRVSLDERALDGRIQRLSNRSDSVLLGLIGYTTNRIKGVDVAIRALAILGPRYRLEVVGGTAQPWLDKIADKCGVRDQVVYKGHFSSREDVLEWLDDLDIYLQPSLTEGLPRSTVEAMSRACPVVSSTAGGLKTLVQSELQTKPGDYRGLASTIAQVAGDQDRLRSIARTNFERARRFDMAVLDPIRDEFYRAVAGGDKS